MSSDSSDTPPVDVLIVGAYAPDLRAIRNHLGERMYGEIRGLRVCAKSVGIGMSVAGSHVTKRLFQLSPRAVIHVGTCGIYPDQGDYRPDDLLIPPKLRLVDHGVLAGTAKAPDPMQEELALHKSLCAGLATHGSRVFQQPVACTPTRTTSAETGREIAKRYGCHAENMEAFAVAQACHLLQVPVACVLAATHVIGPTAEQDHRNFERDAVTLAGDQVINWIGGGAAGIPLA